MLRAAPALALRRARPFSSARSPHAQWYADVVPAMVPIALLGSAVYLGLQLAQSHLAQEKFMDDARARVLALEAEIAALQAERRHTPAPAASSRTWRLW